MSAANGGEAIDMRHERERREVGELLSAGEHAEADHAFADTVPEWPGSETSRE